jgi:RHS repeat-associated protein
MNSKRSIFVLAALLLATVARADDPFTVTPTLQKRAVFSCSDFTFSDGLVDSQGISNNVLGNRGNVASNGNVKMSGGATVNGDAVAGPGKAVTNSGSSTVSGTKTVATAAESCTPLDITTLPSTLAATNDNSRIPLTGANKNPLGGSTHTEFTLSGGDTITLPAGTYYFTKFTVSGGSTITLTGATKILCTGRVDISGGSFVNPQPYRFRFWVSGSGPLTLSGGSSLAGFIYAPNSPATISSSRLIGSIFANQVTISGGTSHVTRAIDDVKPAVAITEPLSGAIVDPAHVLVKGTAADAEGPVTVAVNGQSATVASDGTWQITVTLNSSTTTITAVATDLAANSNSASVTVSTVPPATLSLTSPAPNSWVNTRFVNLSGGAGNAASVTVNNQQAIVTNGAWSLANFDLGADGAHTLAIAGSGAAPINPIINNDTVAPTITATASPAPNAAGWNNSNVTVTFTCADERSGIVSCSAPVTISDEGAGLTANGVARDRAGNTTALVVSVNIDKTAPQIAFTSPLTGAGVADPILVAAGSAGDATSISVNGVAAAVDSVNATFTSAPLTLIEGNNSITATGSDRAGNSGSATITVNLDTRAPELTIAAPAANACLSVSSVELRGSVSDPHLQGVTVRVNGADTAAVVTADQWSATIPVAEGRQVFTVTAADTLGHTNIAGVTVNVDRTAPAIEVTENGAPFTATLVNRTVALLFRTNDASTISAKLDNVAYASGTTITAEGAHTLVVTATDCANQTSTKTLQFTIDKTAPSLTNLVPAANGTVGTLPSTISGSASESATVSVAGISAATDASRNFTLAGIPFSEGTNSFILHAVDAAGNAADVAYVVNVRTKSPQIEIVDNGVPIVSGSLYTRAVTPVIRVSMPDATITATLDGHPFTSGTAVNADADHAITATATDPLGHTATASANFTIDTNGPVVTIAAPAPAAIVSADTVIVSGNAGDSVTVTVNGIAAALTGGTYSATVPLEAGENTLVATGRDRAGNSGSASVTITRTDSTSGVVITYPPDTLLTNRPTTVVAGRVLTPADLKTITIESRGPTQSSGVIAVAPDLSGGFRIPDLRLFEGANTITVVVTSKSNSVTAAVVHVTADLTPPALRILGDSKPLDDGARFDTGVVLSLSTSDPATLQLDGVTVAAPVTVTAAGGHTVVAVASDPAKNETRVVRSFTIGAQSAACALGDFDPKDGAVVTANSVTLIGTSGGATSVTVNGVAANVANGMFSALVELPAEGANSVGIACGQTSKTITFLRVTGAPSVSIDLPAAELAPFGTEPITVSGTVSGAASVDVNSAPAVISNGTWTATNVHLAAGLNVLVARATSAAGRVATASRRVLYLKNAPSISISWPNDGFSTGAATVDVSGTYANLDVNTISGGGTLEPHPFSDTNGSFVLRNVPLVAGSQLLTVTGRDALNRSASASINATRTIGGPSVTITAPLDNSYVSTSSVNVAGSFAPTAGSQVDVNSTRATIAGSAFTATATLNANGPTPIVARVTVADGSTAVSTVLVTRLSAPPSVKLTFPAADATAVDPGAMVIVTFTAPMDGTSLRSALSLLNAAGAPVSGQFRLDRDALTFAPAATLNYGERYTINLKTTAKDLAGNPLDHELTSAFTVVTNAASPPQVNAITAPVCGGSVTITGTTSPNARIQIDYAGATLFTTASSTGAFSQLLGLSSESSYAVARVRVAGADGSFSPFVDVPFTVDCGGASVGSAAYDRTANAITIAFTRPIDMSTITVGASGSIQLALADGTGVSGTAAAGANSSTVVVTPGTPDPRNAALTLTVTTAVKDSGGRALAAAFTRTFGVTADQTASGGDGYVTGQIIDAGNGRPLAGATVSIGSIMKVTEKSGAYTTPLHEGAYTIHASAAGYTDVWRQVVVPAGQGVTPIDIRLTPRGLTTTAASNGVVRAATLNIAAGTLPSGTIATITTVGAQGLAGLLPLGWSPLTAAEVRISGAASGMGSVAFSIPGPEVAASGKALAAIAYDSARDAWRVIQPAVAVTGDNAAVTFALAPLVDLALVYPDAGSGINAPPVPVSGGMLTGVADACATGCAAMHVSKPFTLNPAIVLPNGSSVATLFIDVAGNPFPSGTAVNALVNEELRLVGGGVTTDVPFSTDLVLYRALSGAEAVADFKLAPSDQAAKVPLQIGFDHIQIFPYPGRLDRGTLVGPSGGRVPSDANVQVDIPTSATAVPLHATAKSITDFAPFGGIAGFDIVAGFTLTLDPAEELVKPATATFTVDASAANGQLILAEVLPSTTFGRLFRLADRMNAPQPIASTTKVSVATTAIDPSVLPVDGIVRGGQYLLLRATAPIAFAFGGVRVAGSGYLGGAAVVANSLGVRDLSRTTGIFAIPVVATPAAPFTLTPIHPTLGEGAALAATSAPNAGDVRNVGDLLFTVQAPRLEHVNISGAQGGVDLLATNGATEISLSTGVQAVFSENIDASSVRGSSLIVTNNATGKAVAGSVTVSGPSVTWTPTPNPSGQPLVPNATYIVTIDGAIKGTHQAPLGATQTLSFSTITQLTNAQLNAKRIRITIPDDNGFSTVIGDAGALPTVPPEPRAWRAIAVRRGNAFVTQYQVTANSDGSFSFAIGNCGSTVKCVDAVSIKDHIDLEILNAADNIAAILPLTPFVTADGQGFIAPTDVAVSFTAKDGVAINVPAGAFDQPTIVRAARLDTDAPFAAVPSIHDEMNFYRGVNLTFDCTVGGGDATNCVAKKRLDVSIPVPSGLDPNGRNFLLGWLGDSVRGPRVMIVDTLRVENGAFTTTAAPNAQATPQRVVQMGTIVKKPTQSAPGAPVITSFDANPSTIRAGSSTTLSWSTTNASAVVINNGIGAVAASGSIDVAPVANTTYTLTAGNGSGIAEKQAGVTVTSSTNGNVLTAQEVKTFLLGVIRAGAYNVIDMRSSVGWMGTDSLQGNYDLFFDMFNSLFLSHVYLNEPHGRVLMPVKFDTPFQIVGYDAGTGLQAFSKAYDPIAPGDPGAAFVVPSPNVDQAGPYPVLASPLHIDVVDVLAVGVDITSARHFLIRLENGQISLSPSADDPLPLNVNVRLLNVSSGSSNNYDEFGPALSVAGKAGDRVIVISGAENVDPSTELTLVFNKAIWSGNDKDETSIDSYLHTRFFLEKASKPLPGKPPEFKPINDLATYRVDSGNIRVRIELPSSLERGALYRLTIRNTLADQSGAGVAGLRIGEISQPNGSPKGTLSKDIVVEFEVRDVPDPLTHFNIRQGPNQSMGNVRDLALNGNLLLIAALDGGVLAYDVADPASLTSTTLPAGRIDAGPNQFWSVASDEHGRVFAAGVGPVFGFIQSYRLDDFVKPCDPPGGPASTPPKPPCPNLVTPRSSTTVSWAPGYGSNVDIATDKVLSDRPEGIPRKLQIAVQDNDVRYDNRAAFMNGVNVTSQSNIGEFKMMSVSINREPNPPPDPNDPPNTPPPPRYRMQRITVENLTRDMRWSADAIDENPAVIDNIVAKADDAMRVVYNERTYGVVTIFGYGVGVFDLNAVESNDLPGTPPDGTVQFSERIRLTPASSETACAPSSTPGVIRDLAFSAEAAIIPSTTTSAFTIYGLDIHKGVLDVRMTPPAPPPANTPLSVLPPSCDDRSPVGLRFLADPATISPRIFELNKLFKSKAGRDAAGRFASIQTYHWTLEAQDNKALAPPPTLTSPAPGARGSVAGTRVVRDYLLVPANEYGLLVIDTTKPSGFLGQGNLADIIWIPAGAVSVRPIPRTNLALVVDGEGRILLVDLSRLDERYDSKGVLIASDALFKTVAIVLNKEALKDKDGPIGVGAPDPRILWSSEKGVVNGNVTPIIDPDTGIVFAGKLLLNLEKNPGDTAMAVIAALDPRIQIRADLGKGGLAEVGGIVPLGVEPPAGVINTKDPNASLGAFRLQISLPGAIVEKLKGTTLRLAVESERVPGAVVEQTPAPFPRTHLRMTTPAGSNDSRAASGFAMTRDVPAGMESVLRRQRGFNRFISPWVVSIADPRASRDYVDGVWNTTKELLGCVRCDRPQRLQTLTEADGVYEIWSGGRDFRVRPEICGGAIQGCSGLETIFKGTKYDYLAQADRLSRRFATIPGDTTRPKSVLIGPNHPPVADGLMQETVYLHSGELETGNVDLDAGGRNGWNVVFDRTYHSRTMVAGFLGLGWSSSIYRGVRALPNGTVEYRDGSGETWLFKAPSGPGQPYTAPLGSTVNLVRTSDGFQTVDEKRRVTTFDAYGRLSTETDEFGTVGVTAKGNTIRYLYDLSGRLKQIVDPVGRASTLTYWDDANAAGWKAGRLKQVDDWRHRKIDYDYDDKGRLVSVTLPDFEKPSSLRPVIHYGYVNASSAYTDFVDLAPQLKTITDPKGDGDRVTYDYGTGTLRGRVTTETWGTGESVSFNFADAANPIVTDALKQVRLYKLTAAPADANADRVHVREMIESDVPVASVGGVPIGVAKLPATATPGSVNSTPQERKYTFGHDQGLLKTTTLEGVSSTTIGYNSDPSRPPRYDGSTTTPLATPGSGMPVSASQPVTMSMIASEKDGAFITSMKANGLEIKRPEPFRDGLTTSAKNDEVTSNATYDVHGQLTNVVNPTGGTDTAGAGASMTIEYQPELDSDFRRSLPHKVTHGSLTTTVDYPDKDNVTSLDPRGVTTQTTYDAYGRSIRVTVSGADVSPEETSEFDANGWLHRTTRKQKDKTITTTYEYDLVGRLKLVTTDNVAINGGLTSTSTSTSYDLNGHTITTSTLPGGSITTRVIDKLGRTLSSSTTTGNSPIDTAAAYDLAGNLVFQADKFVATAWAYDSHGRRIAELHSDGTTATFDHNAWGGTTEVVAKDAQGAQLVKQTNDILDAGTLKKQTVDTGNGTRSTSFAWDGAGRTTKTALSGATVARASRAEFDDSGRMKLSESGAGTLTNISDVFSRVETTSHNGTLPALAVSSERAGIGNFKHTFDYNALGAAIRQETGSLKWEQHFDEAGNVTSVKPPARPETTYQHDARGAVTEETLADGVSKNQYEYDVSSSLKTYRDPLSEATTNGNDQIGRPTSRLYADGSSETWTWDGPRLTSYTDRQGRKQQFGYDAPGRITDITDAGNNKTDHLDYDSAGRMTAWTTRDAKIEYSNFDGEGRPAKTRQIRYADSTGFTTTTVLDTFEQTHTWNAAGERTSWTMPRVPASGNWTTSVNQSYDAAGNLATITRTLLGATVPTSLMSAQFRNAGRPSSRNVTTASNAPIVRTYTYDDNDTGQLTEMRVDAAGLTVAGAHVGYDGLQVNDVQLLGVSGDTRHTHYSYDTRGRLIDSTYAVTGASVAGKVTEQPNKADFRESQKRTPRLDAATRSILAKNGVYLSAIDPTSTDTGEQPGHKVASISIDGKPPRAVTYDHNASLVNGDGEFFYTWDEKGRLTIATEKPKSTGFPLRRVRYFYNGNNRMVGRRAESAPINSLSDPVDSLSWQLETRANILAIDGLPAETTFVWDPISDNIVSVFKAGAADPSDTNGGLLKQVVHGGLSYDDPIEVTMPSQRLYPVYDEAGDGNLQAVIDAGGKLVARNIPSDPYGADALDVSGAAVDRVEVHAKKDNSGNLQSVDVTVHSTEAIAATTVAAGLRLSAVNASGTAVSTSSIVPQLADPYSARFTLTPAQWTTLTTAAGAESLSVAVTTTLRAQAWSSAVPFLPPPDWAKATSSVYSNPYAVEVRDSLSTLATFVSTISSGAENTRTLYKLDTLALAATPGGSPDPISDLLAARFQAQPFAEPFTHKFYVRERWLDPVTGTWLSPDPMGYRDSSNLYGFCGGDPVNCSDPDGLRAMTEEDRHRLATLKSRGKKLYDDFTTARRGSFLQPLRVPVAQEWHDTSGVAGGNFETQMVSATVTTQAMYELAKRTMVNDIATFEAAVARADADGEILYVPGQGFTTITAADRKTANTATWIAAGTFFAADAVPMMLSPYTMKQPLQPVRICQGVCGPEFENAEFDPTATRPGKRKGTVEAIKARAPKTPYGDFIDPNTGEIIPQDGPFDFGHVPGHEWWRTRAEANAKNWSREDVNENQNDPKKFQIEIPSSNRSRRYEKKP